MSTTTTPCTRCGRALGFLAPFPFCACGGVPRVPALANPGARHDLADGPRSVWRAARAFPFLSGATRVCLGDEVAPLEPLALPGLAAGIRALRDDLLPTGSWKDRGSAVLVSALAAAGVTDVIEDSSGNAALSLARYAHAAGIALTTFVPHSASPVKKALIAAAGATLVEIPGPRRAATLAAHEAARGGRFWAAHAAQPLHAAGAATAAFDCDTALGRMPGAVVMPAGQGGLLVGVAAGFRALAAAGRGTMPRLIGVQSTACAPLAAAFTAGLDAAGRWDDPRPSLADGVVIAEPARDREALAAVRESGGALVAVDDLALDRAVRLLWREGFRVEPTAALGVAWLLGPGRAVLRDTVDVVVILTGHGIRDGQPLVTGL